VRFSKTIRTSIRNPVADETVTEVADDPCRAYLIANNIRISLANALAEVQRRRVAASTLRGLGVAIESEAPDRHCVGGAS
jgi:hypothetical protein